MEPKVLVVFHTSEGQTARIAERIAGVLRREGSTVEVFDAGEAPAPGRFDAVVAGDSIHAGHHSRALTNYLTEHVAVLNALPTALFQVSLTSATPGEEHTTTAQHMMNELLAKTGFDPDIVGLFAGALVYTQYGWLKRHIMRSIAQHEGGDTDTSRDYDYTDWGAVEHFAEDVAALARASTASATGE